MDESIEKSGSLFYGLNSPTLKVASLNLVSRTKKSASRQGCGLFDMIGGKQTCGLQVRSTFNPPEAVRRAAPSQVASSNLVSPKDIGTSPKAGLVPKTMEKNE